MRLNSLKSSVRKNNSRERMQEGEVGWLLSEDGRLHVGGCHALPEVEGSGDGPTSLGRPASFIVVRPHDGES